MVQSTLDAIFAGFLPRGNSHGTLHRLIQDSLPSIKLDQPLLQLSSSLRAGEPLDVVFKSTDPLSRELADTLMSLVEKLITYLYVLPAEFDELDSQLATLSRELRVALRPAQQEQKDRAA
jgi:hypothetical protein